MDKNCSYPFSALLSRMKYITRWGLMRSSRTETLSEHTTEVAMLSHLLAIIGQTYCGQTNLRPETVAVAALYHDASEILTGDLPTPVKYKSEALRGAYKALEEESARSLATLLPDELQAPMLPYLTGTLLTTEEKALLKAADRLSALIKCMEEEASGNTEFASAKRSQLQALQQMDCPAANYFLRNMLPCYAQNLDELTGGCP
ncbi:5'-deoxynucleotidase [Ruminococcaceae bacterium OttesenSCG-928-A16]|nr:5'-deoxynucleotidase [Ruminococcaceae bacterium OttesenSCG-928-A16]